MAEPASAATASSEGTIRSGGSRRRGSAGDDESPGDQDMTSTQEPGTARRLSRQRSGGRSGQDGRARPSDADDAPTSATRGADTGQPPGDTWQADVAGLSFLEARTALELVMAKLQSDQLEVEEMAGLYRRAEAFARRCEAVLNQVEQDVVEWEAHSTAPTP